MVYVPSLLHFSWPVGGLHTQERKVLGMGEMGSPRVFNTGLQSNPDLQPWDLWLQSVVVEGLMASRLRLHHSVKDQGWSFWLNLFSFSMMDVKFRA